MKIKRILLNNLGLKLLALVFAILTWAYVGEATKEGPDKTVLQKLLTQTAYISKTLTVKPIFVGSVPEGHSLLESNVRIEPESIVVIGPSKILSKREVITTKPIDLAEHTIDKTIDVELESISRSIKFQKIKVQVYLPVKKLDSITK